MPVCMNCGAIGPCDSKPARFAGVPVTNRDLGAAARAGEDFSREECAACFGPAYLPPDPEEEA
jgi:hypothetical protein